jgi:hypothetical protein
MSTLSHFTSRFARSLRLCDCVIACLLTHSQNATTTPSDSEVQNFFVKSCGFCVLCFGVSVFRFCVLVFVLRFGFVFVFAFCVCVLCFGLRFVFWFVFCVFVLCFRFSFCVSVFRFVFAF